MCVRVCVRVHARIYVSTEGTFMNSGVGAVVLEDRSGFLREKTLTRCRWPAKFPRQPLGQSLNEEHNRGNPGLSTNLDTPGPSIWFPPMNGLMRVFRRARRGEWRIMKNNLSGHLGRRGLKTETVFKEGCPFPGLGACSPGKLSCSPSLPPPLQTAGHRDSTLPPCLAEARTGSRAGRRRLR